MSCGASLAQPIAEERRTVSILFADLVGFTERSDAADPEDVRRTLVPFHEHAKGAIERFGGTLDKFIGDAAMGVFGAPVAHEDDPERAVRAAFDLLAAASGDHPIRVAVNTGEAVVKMGAGPQVGEAVAGDVVNTTSRMQSVAPPGGVVVGELTWRSVRDRFEAEELEPFVAKGKAEPIRVWRVLGEREDVDQGPVAPLVGRRRELDILRQTVERASDERCAQLVTIVSEPGIGKSRLVSELHELLAGEVTWLEGACAPYGDANALAPLRQVVRRLAGVDAGDDAPTVDAALGSLVARAESVPTEQEWLRARLAVVADVVRAEDRDRQIPPAEVAMAAASVLSAAAADRPIVVVIEDLHWSEAVLRDVLSQIVDDGDAPIVIACTARPELFDADPSWGGGRANSTTIRLMPLTDRETATLVEVLLTSVIQSEAERREVLTNIGGNPLFAVEFVRMLQEQHLAGTEVPMSVQAVIGARLDSVVAERRAVLQDASVVGASFWPDALAAIGDGDVGDIRGALAELTRRGLVVRSSSSSFPEQAEYGFGHALIREVAYSRLPRMARAHKHASVGMWLESAVGDRRDAFLDALARHFEQAVLLADASGERRQADAWRARAAEGLFEAGRATMPLDPAGAFARFERVLAIADEEDPWFVQALAHSGLAGRRAGLLSREEVLARHERAAAMYHERGDAVAEARAHTSIGGQMMGMGFAEEARAHFATGEELLAAHPEATVERALVNAWLAEVQMFAGNPGPAAEFAGRALATEAADPPVAIMALHIRGDSRIALGDGDGIDDLREALRLAEEIGSVSDIITSHSYLADREWMVDGPTVALARLDQASGLADRRGAFSQGSWTKISSLEILFELGRWNELLARAELSAGDQRLDESLLLAIDLWTSAVALRRGQPVGDLANMLARAHALEELQVLGSALALSALCAARDGDRARAAAIAREFEETTRGKSAMYRSEWAPDIVRVARDVGAADVARDIVSYGERVTPRDALLLDTAAAVLEGDGADAATWAALEDRWHAYGNLFQEALAALALGRVSDDAEATGRGRAILDRLGVPAETA